MIMVLGLVAFVIRHHRRAFAKLINVFLKMAGKKPVRPHDWGLRHIRIPHVLRVGAEDGCREEPGQYHTDTELPAFNVSGRKHRLCRRTGYQFVSQYL